MRVFVTGGAGFIGSHLVEKLLAEKIEVSAFVRETTDLTHLPIDKITLHKGDLSNLQSLEDAMQNCDAIVHIAALASDWGKQEKFYEVNVNGTKNLLKAANKNNINQVVLISSTAVLGEEDSCEIKNENAPYKAKQDYFLSKIMPSGMNYYKETKMIAEKEAIEFSKENNINLTVLRPTWVYGQRELHAGPYEFCKTVLEGIPVLPMGKDNKFHVIYVKDLADAIFLGLKKNLNGVNVFNIGNENPPNIREYFNLFLSNLDVKPPIYAPIWVFYPIAILLELLAVLFNAEEPYLLTRARVKMFYCNNTFDVKKAKEVLGFVAKTPLDEGIKQTVSWWKENKSFEDKKIKQSYVTGIKRVLLDLEMALAIPLHYFKKLIKKEISLKQYMIFIKRLVILADLLKNYKAVKIKGSYKINLYLPAFKTPSFYTAIDKFLNIDGSTVASHVVFSMTKACLCNCEHCYQKHDENNDLELDKLLETAKNIQDIGVSLFDIEGGEPFIRYDRLLELTKSLDERSELWINSTGHLITYEKALELKENGLYGIMFSIHHPSSDKHDEFMGTKGSFDAVKKAVAICHQVGLASVINTCLSLELIKEDGIEKIMDLGKELGCSYVQVIHEKPAGGWVDRGNSLMDKDLIESLINKHNEFNTNIKYKDYPSMLMQVFESSKQAFGCTAGGIERFYVNASGEVQPCEFMNISCGNVNEEDFLTIYNRMRNLFKKPGTNWLCNSECEKINNFIKENNIKNLPIKKDDAIKLIESFNKGENVALFERMKLCDKL